MLASAPVGALIALRTIRVAATRNIEKQKRPVAVLAEADERIR
jgi:hypothetical protein